MSDEQKVDRRMAPPTESTTSEPGISRRSVLRGIAGLLGSNLLGRGRSQEPGRAMSGVSGEAPPPGLPSLDDLPPELRTQVPGPDCKPPEFARFAKVMGVPLEQIPQLLQERYRSADLAELTKALEGLDKVEPIGLSGMAARGEPAAGSGGGVEPAPPFTSEQMNALKELEPEAQKLLHDVGDPKKQKNIWAFLAKMQDKMGEDTKEVLLKCLRGGTITIGIFALIFLIIAVAHAPRGKQ